MASQARHQSVSPKETSASRYVVPVEGRGRLSGVNEATMQLPNIFGPYKKSRLHSPACTAAGLAILLLAGCAVGPNYKRAAVASPAAYRGENAAGTNSLGELPWWEVFKDGTLTNLIRTALTNNFDARIAVTRVEQARALAMQAKSQLFPQINYDGQASRGRNALLGNANPVGTGTTANSFLGTVNAAWEVDLWGRVRRLDEAGRAQYLASVAARRGVLLSVSADVAQAWFELLELDQELEIARRTSNSFAESLKVFGQRLAGGVGSRLETSRAEAALATTAATVPDLERRIAIKENQISVLLGHNPGPISRSTALLEQSMPPEIPEGLPSELLERRPDIRQAEQLARAANAQIGVAVGNFLPKFGLTALYGGVSPELSTITSASGRLWSIGANVTGPIFQGGLLYGQYKQAKAAWEEAQLLYQQTALNAFQDVANALVARQKYAELRVQLARAVSAYREAVKVSTQRYMAGNASYYEVLEAQQELFPAELALAQTELNQFLAVVQLYKALGGGWNLTDAEFVGGKGK
jgi:multidrug efflux system outer membrane protein